MASRIVNYIKNIINPYKHYLHILPSRLAQISVAGYTSNTIRAFWYTYDVNFGDLLTPALLLSYGYLPIIDTMNHSQLMSTGSIINCHLDKSYSGIILGSGVLVDENAGPFPNACILALRGEITKQKIGCHDEVLLADPGLLACRFVENDRSAESHELGIVAHYWDRKANAMNLLRKRFNDHHVTFIDVQSKPQIVVNQIARCKHIVSSSLHGLIVADSIGIPNARFSINSLLGGDLKFDDYYSSFGLTKGRFLMTGQESMDELIGRTAVSPQNLVAEKQERLDVLFRSLNTILKERSI